MALASQVSEKRVRTGGVESPASTNGISVLSRHQVRTGCRVSAYAPGPLVGGTEGIPATRIFSARGC